LTRQFDAKTHIFSRPQEELWNQLGQQLPDHFVLYGDSALGLRMGHRPSPDFEFKSARHFSPGHMLRDIPFLRDAELLESRWSYLKVAVGGPNPVEMTFEGGQTMAQIHPPERASNGLAVASLADLAGQKMYRLSERVTEVDCRDLASLLYEGTTIDEMIGFAKAQYGERFDPLKASLNLTTVDRSNMNLDRETQAMLIKEGAQGRLPALTPVNAERITTESREPTQRMPHKHNFQRAVDPYDLRDPLDQHDPREERER
jgi:hypothetical protein